MPATEFKVQEKYKYQNGFGSYHEYVLPSSAYGFVS